MIPHAIRDLLEDVGRHPAFQQLRRLVQGEAPPRVSLSGLCPAAKALYTVLLWQSIQRPVLAIVAGQKEAEVLAGPVQAFFDLLAPGRGACGPQMLPAPDVLPFQRLSPHAEISESRAIALWRMATARSSITIIPVQAALLRNEAPEFYAQLALTLRSGEEVPFDDVIAHLESAGYEPRDPVDMVGDFSVRGGILDVFPPESSRPFRLEFFGDLIESIRQFDVETQRSVLKVDSALVLPLRERPATPELLAAIRAKAGAGSADGGTVFPGWELLAPLVRPQGHSAVALLERPVLVCDEPASIRTAAGRLWERLEQRREESPVAPEASFYNWDGFAREAEAAPQISLEELEVTVPPEQPGGPLRLHIPTRPSLSFRGNMRVAVAEARNLVEEGHRVAFFAPSVGEVERLADIFQQYSVPFQLGVDSSVPTPQYLAERVYVSGAAVRTFVVKAALGRGAIFPDAHLALFGFEDLFESSDLVARPPAPRSHLATFSGDLADLKAGDYVVHAEHGIGCFLGLRELALGDQKGDFMMIEYASEAKLYVPLARLDLVQRYRGAGDSKPALDRLGGVTWNRTKGKVKARLRDMAGELLKLYAQRKLVEGFAFSPDSNWQREFEDAFEFEPTRDQLTAVQEIKRDMENPQPMDRLLCGDVGFGKTEVAMRAAFKTLADGKQVAVLAPTTVLAYQHFETLKTRFAPFPVRVEMLSRFRTPREIKPVLADLAAGKVDVVVGTHRLLSADVQFADLGLLVVDEEQRFGVRHKERLKQLRQNMDVLTMTATPIPRTLHMSLLGIRDLSVIETPPRDRLAVHTVVAHFHPEIVRAAIEQELGRGGQVYFIHNRIESIWARAALVQELAPQARVVVGHGQMGEAALEKVVLRFMRHECDVLVSTTIVENGLDIPLANTMIVDHAERYGLSELYQLRGRVGRSNRRAYAYLLVPPDTEISEVARKRLAALREFSELGAGFKIAALDLELRGAGNLLGAEQHGQIGAVGYETYVRMLEETVRELRGEEVTPIVHTSINLALDIRIPPEYIADEHQRLRAYKRIADVDDETRARDVLAELADRYGPPPEAVSNLLEFALLKSLAARLGIEAVERRQGVLNLKFHQQSKVSPPRLMDLVASTPGAQFTPAGVLRLPADGAQHPGAVLERLKGSLLRLLE